MHILIILNCALCIRSFAMWNPLFSHGWDPCFHVPSPQVIFTTFAMLFLVFT